MAFNPCPCMSLRKGVKILAVINAIIAEVFLVVFATILILLTAVKPDERFPPELKAAFILIFALGISFIFVVFVLAVVLWKGAKKRSSNLCTIWMIITIILIFCTVVWLICNLAKGRFGYVDLWLVLWILIKCFEISVVYAFCRQMNSSGEVENGNVYSQLDMRLLVPRTDSLDDAVT